MRVVDSHLHLWDPELLRYPWLEGPLNYLFEDIELQQSRVQDAVESGSVFIQAECVEEQFLDEVRWVAGRADRTGVSAIVAGIRLDRGDRTVLDLAALAEHHLVVGVRHILEGETEGLATTTAFLDGARALAARGWTFDACVVPSQLRDVAALAAAVPGLRIVLDHLGKPVVGAAAQPVAPSVDWIADLVALAQHPNVFCKLSGLPACAGGDWDAARLEPFLDAAADAFGAERLMWGSDWPVSVIGPAEEGDPYAPEDGSPTYQYTARTRWARAVESWATLRGIDAAAVMADNAERFYGIRRLTRPATPAASAAPAASPSRPKNAESRGLVSRFLGWLSGDRA